MRPVFVAAALACAGCSDEAYIVPAQEPSPPPPAATIYIEGASELPPVALPREDVVVRAASTERVHVSADAERVHIYPDKDIGRATEVVGVLDFHTDASSQDKGFEELKRKAATLGADAVIGAEFEHGDAGEKSHLSGMAVRFVDR